MKTMYRSFVFLIAAALLSACAALGLPQAETFNQKAAVAYGTVQSVVDTATTLLQAKKITADDAQSVQASADVAKQGIDTARKIHLADPTAANAKLDAIRTGLTALSAYLATKK